MDTMIAQCKVVRERQSVDYTLGKSRGKGE